MTYTWGYLKENTLSKLNLSEEEANQQGFLSNFPYYANEAMTQICSAIKPHYKYHILEVVEEEISVPFEMPEDFISFSDGVALYNGEEADDSVLDYFAYNQVICNKAGYFVIPYNARWFFFTKDLPNNTVITAPADICDAIPLYMASQCYKIDDDTKAAIYRNEFEIALSRIDDTDFKSQRSFKVRGNW